MKKLLLSLSMMFMALAASAQSCPDNNHPHIIDLGLPSGTKWACCNVGANKPENYGGYYAWGETEEKDSCDLNNYTHCDGSILTFHDIGSVIAGTPFDVAHVKWGGNWVMPSPEQIKELLDNCLFDWATISNVDGLLLTSKENKNYIFLPAAGLKGFELMHVGKGGYYWSSTQYPSEPINAYHLHLYPGGVWWNSNSVRFVGYSIRPVWIP